jgi:hypothetical protein
MAESSIGALQWLEDPDKGSDCILQQCDPGEVLNVERRDDNGSTALGAALRGVSHMINSNVRSPMGKVRLLRDATVATDTTSPRPGHDAHGTR